MNPSPTNRLDLPNISQLHFACSSYEHLSNYKKTRAFFFSKATLQPTFTSAVQALCFGETVQAGAAVYSLQKCAILGALAKFRKSFVMSVRLSAWNNSAPAGRIFMKFDI